MRDNKAIARNDRPPSGAALELLQRIAEAIERMERNQDNFYRAFLNARFPFGKPSDKWRRSA